MVNLSIYLGRRGAGKSTLAAMDARYASAEDVMVIVHDPLGGFPHMQGLRRVGSLASAKAVAASGEITVLSNGQFDEIVSWLRAVSPKMPNGSLLVIDEGVLLTTTDQAEKLRRKIRECAAVARHAKLRIAIVAQGSMLIDHSLVSMADKVAVFGLVGGYERVKMEACGIPRQVVDKLPTLPDHEYFRGVPGRPWHEWNHHSTRPLV